MRGAKKTALIVLDGWGIGPAWGGNAIMQASTPNMDFWTRKFPHSKLRASGEAVGLPKNTGGNSETGHLNLGSGRIIPQNLYYINKEIENQSFFTNKIIISAFNHSKKYTSNLHIMGLVGTGHVHSDIDHLFSLVKMAKDNNVKKLFLHLFTDGRDSDPASGLMIIEKISKYLDSIGIGEIASISGRSYSMDRNNNWGKTSRSYNSLTKGEAEIFKSPRECIARYYQKSISDEFIEPSLIADNPSTKNLISDNDSLIFYNYRPDRARQISRAFSTEYISEMPDRKIINNLHFVTFVARDPKVYGIEAFPLPVVKNTISEIFYNNRLRQLHISETEKYAHVTYFFNGGKETPWPGETQHLVPSPKVSEYDQSPRMSSDLITKYILKNSMNKYDFIIINFANGDMVGHTGNYYATVKAIEAVDENLGKVTNYLLRENYSIFIVADHGNAEDMLNPITNQPYTEHSSNPVPFIILSKNLEINQLKLSDGSLCDVAPTILSLMDIQIPAEMSGKNLIQKNND